MNSIHGIDIPEAIIVLDYNIVQEDEISTEIEGTCEVDDVWEEFSLSINPQYATFSCNSIITTLHHKRGVK